MPVKKWKGPEAMARIRSGFARNLAAAAIVVKTRAKVLLSVAGTNGQGRNAKGQFKRVYGSNPSAPGEPPHKQTGHLRRSVAHDVDKGTLSARVGTNVKYGRWLELGTSKMAARPWLRRALNESLATVRAILAKRPAGM
jgi:HK97 gp10 family phage protein